MESEKITGTCYSMCPEAEIKLRQREGLLHRLEISDSKLKTNQSKNNFSYVVKQFSRSAAGQHMQNAKCLRPGPVLVHTVKYLLEEIINSEETSWHIVYAFVTDRLRAVRQDMIIQRISRSYCVAILQPIVRFHAYAAYRLCEESVTNFDPVLNKLHLNECLKMLLSLYDEFEVFGEQYPDKVTAKIKSGSKIQSYDFDGNTEKTRPFMEALYLILNLGHSDPILRAVILPEKFKTNIVNKALKLSLFYRNGNWVKVCQLMKELPPLLAGVSSLHLPEIRKKAMEVMSSAYNSKNLTFPAKILQNVLLYNTIDDLIIDLTHYGISVFDNNCIQFLKSNFIKEQNTESIKRKSLSLCWQKYGISGKCSERGGCNVFQGAAAAASKATCTAKCMGACSPGGSGGCKSPTMASKRNVAGGGKCMGKEKGQLLSILLTIREPIAEYQQKGGLGRYEQVGFLCLLTSIYQQAYQACLAFLTMLCNLLPFIDVFLLVVRFALDKLICIVKTDNVGSAVMGVITLTGEIFVVILMLGLICMFLLFPVLSLVFSFVYRLTGMN